VREGAALQQKDGGEDREEKGPSESTRLGLTDRKRRSREVSERREK